MSQPPTFPPKKLPGEVDAAPRAETPGTPAPSPAPRFPASVVPAAPAPTPQTQTAPTSRFGAPTAPQSTTGSRFGAPASPQMPPSNRFGAPATPAGGGHHPGSLPPVRRQARIRAAAPFPPPARPRPQAPWANSGRGSRLAATRPRAKHCPAALWVKHRRARPQRRKALFPAVRDSALPAFPRQTRTFVLPHRLWAAQRAPPRVLRPPVRP